MILATVFFSILFLFFFFFFCLLTVYSFSIFGCKEHNQSDFSTDYLVMSTCTVISWVAGKDVCYDQYVLLTLC